MNTDLQIAEDTEDVKDVLQTTLYLTASISPTSRSICIHSGQAEGDHGQ